MTAFAVCQEGIRALRGGEHDAWTSAAAGALAGATLTRIAHGRGFQLLGAVVWGPLCGGLHWLNSTLQPGAVVKNYLISKELLDPPPGYAQQQRLQQQLEAQAYQQQQQQYLQKRQASSSSVVQQQQAAEPQQATAAEQRQLPIVPKRLDELTWAEKRTAVDEIRKRELGELQARLKEQQQQQQHSPEAGSDNSSGGNQQQQQQQSRNRWWLSWQQSGSSLEDPQ
eukprot:GHRR01023741.1.p1 GENE.GHRR01023741.1~~GHRR01023741.1.p1  ORF type:complete len:251 (+),score=124.67 GHRR01023741.1:81-755(+)